MAGWRAARKAGSWKRLSVCACARASVCDVGPWRLQCDWQEWCLWEDIQRVLGLGGKQAQLEQCAWVCWVMDPSVIKTRVRMNLETLGNF